MADTMIETNEPDPSATSIANDETVNNESASALDTTNNEVVAVDAPIIDTRKEATDGVTASENIVTGISNDVSVETEGYTASGSVELKDSRIAETDQGSEPKVLDDSKAADKNDHDTSRQAKQSGRNGTTSNRGGRGGGFDRTRRDYSKNVKSDLTSQPESNDPVAIRKQVEFYFSDSNLPMDKFLFGKVEGHKNNPVPIDVVHAFKRMRHFQPFSAVVAALKESDVLDVVENETAIKRKIPLAENLQDKDHTEVQKVYQNAAMARTVYVKGFGKEQPSTQFDLEAFFTPHGPINSVRLRRTQEKDFKGSVFVEFDSEVTAKKFLDLDSKPKWNDNDLVVKSKKQYCDDKVNDINAGRLRKNSPSEDKSRTRNDNDSRDWRERRSEDQKKGHRDDRKGGGHRGYGSGRGRGRGGRGGRGGRDRNDERQKQKDEHEVPKIATTTENPPTKLTSTETDSSKKRPHVGDETLEVQPKAKKVDTKDES